MSIRNLVGRLKRALFHPETARPEPYARELLELGRKQLILQKPLYRLHLHNLEAAADMAVNQMTFGYALERAARKLNLKIMGNDLSKPTLCMVCTGDEYAKIVAVGTETKSSYCQEHGYNFAILDSEPYRFDRHPAWLRIPLMFRLMQLGHQRLFYLDADSLITNPEVLLEGFFERLEKSGRHLMVAEDIYSINTGALFLRKTWQSLTLLDLVYESYTGLEKGDWDQGALIALIEQHPAVKSMIYLETNARLFNSMPFERRAPGLPPDCSNYAWQPGDFICHFAGTKNSSELAAQMQKFHQLSRPT